MYANFTERLLYFAPLLLVAVSGCGSESPSPTSVTGRVKYLGQPVTTGTVVFTPDSDRGSAGLPVCAEIQQDGSYQLKSEETSSLAPGWYRITVAAVEMSPGQSGQPRSLLPDKYRDPAQSGLMCEIKAGKDNAINFNLE